LPKAGAGRYSQSSNLIPKTGAKIMDAAMEYQVAVRSSATVAISVLTTLVVEGIIKFIRDKKDAERQAKLKTATSERQFKFEHIYTRTAESVENMYEKLYVLGKYLRRYMSVGGSPEGLSMQEELEKVGQQYEDTYNCFMLKRLYLRKQTVEKIDQLLKASKKKIIDFKLDVQDGREERRVIEHGTWEDCDRFAFKQYPEILSLLEEEFREVLGAALE
jgi:hypothetical protein